MHNVLLDVSLAASLWLPSASCLGLYFQRHHFVPGVLQLEAKEIGLIEDNIMEL